MKLFILTFALCLAAIAYVSAQSISASETAFADSEPSADYLPPAEAGADAADSTQVGQDGYRYRSVRRLKYRARNRREVSQEYLPPLPEPTQEYLPPPPPGGDSTAVGQDGYRYKTVRRLRLRRTRRRRDVSEIAPPPSDYLPPVDVGLAPELPTDAGANGYRYRTVRRLRFRARHRREAEATDGEPGQMGGSDMSAPANDYLPPNADAPAEEKPAEVKSAELAKDGYRYKTVRRIRYRRRH